MNKIYNIILFIVTVVTASASDPRWAYFLSTAKLKPNFVATTQIASNTSLVFDGPSNLAFKHTDMFVVVGDVSVELFLVNPIASNDEKTGHISRYGFSEPSAKEIEAWITQFGKEKLNPKTTRLFSSTAPQEQKESVRRKAKKSRS